MLTEKFSMSVEAVGSDDGRYTYEIYRKFNDGGKKALVIGIYPTIATDRVGNMDLSTMHLINHASDFSWEELRIVNLYSEVFEGKPLQSQLAEDNSNISYIEELLESDDMKEYDIVIAWGNSLLTHKGTIEKKTDILTMMKEKGLSENVKCIVTDNLVTIGEYGVHPLYLGLRHSKELWRLAEYPLEDELNRLIESISVKQTDSKKKSAYSNSNAETGTNSESKENTGIGSEIKLKKGGRKNVPKNKKQA